MKLQRPWEWAVWAVAWLVVTPSAAQQDMGAVEIRTEKVSRGVAVLFGRGGNIGVSFGEDGALLIDDQYAPLTDKIRAAVGELSDGAIRFVLNTHWHGDHTGGNEGLGGMGSVIVAHDNVRSRMSVDQFMEAFDRTVPASPSGALPLVTFTDDVTLHFNGDEIHAFHTPAAHTDGDIVVHFRKANVVHAGDIYFSGMFPFIDVGSGGGIDGVIAGCDQILALADDTTRIIPGHGPVSGKKELLEYREMLRGARKAVASQVAAGKDVEAIRKADPLAPWNEKWGGGFINKDRFLEILVGSLTK